MPRDQYHYLLGCSWSIRIFLQLMLGVYSTQKNKALTKFQKLNYLFEQTLEDKMERIKIKYNHHHFYFFCNILKIFSFSGKALQIFQILNVFNVALPLTCQWQFAWLIQIYSETSCIGPQQWSGLLLKSEKYWKSIVFRGARFPKISHTDGALYGFQTVVSGTPELWKAPHKPWWWQGFEAEGRASVGLLPTPPLFKQSSFTFIYHIHDD